MALMANAQTITIGEGNGMTDVVPYNTFYNYSFTEQIFLASEIEYAGNTGLLLYEIRKRKDHRGLEMKEQANH